MVKLLLICLAAIVMISCGSEQEKLTVYISDTCTDTLQHEIFLSEEEGLNIFYDLCVTDSFCAFLDARNDTLLKIFTATVPPAFVGLGMKGEGPDDFLFPFFEKSIGRGGKGKLSFIELNSWNKKAVAIHSAASPGPVAVSVVEAQQLPEMPVVRDYNETDSCVYGIDVDMQHGLFFIYDKHTAQVKTVDYHRDIKSGYPEGHLSYLYESCLMVNQDTKAACTGLLNLNSLCFYDLKGNLMKEIVIGKELKYPDYDPEFLDFPNAPKYFISLCGTPNYLYALYNGFPGTSGKSKIMVFTWQGAPVAIYHTDVKLEKIAADPSGRYVLGLNITEEGGSDVLKFDLPLNEV